MDNPDDIAALAYEYLRKQPQENFLAVILDGQGRPIQILRHSLGNISSTGFMPHIIAGVAASTRGARTVYMVHNHPSTTTRFSRADVIAAQFLAKTIAATGFRFGGSLVVSDGDAHEGVMTPKYIFHAGGDLANVSPTPMTGQDETDAVRPVVLFDDRAAAETTADIQVVERTFEVRKDALFPRIANGKDAVEQIPSLLSNLPGVALLDKAGRLVGVVQMSLSEMRNLSSAASLVYPEQGQARDYIKSEDERDNPEQDHRVYKRRKSSKLDVKTGAWNNPLAMLFAAIERSNAEQVIISTGNEEADQGVASDAVRNLQKAIMRVGGVSKKSDIEIAFHSLGSEREDEYFPKISILDVINNNKTFRNQVLSTDLYGMIKPNERSGARLPTGQRLGFDEEGRTYGDDETQGNQEKAPIEGADSIEGIVRGGLQGPAGAKRMSVSLYDTKTDTDKKATAVIGPDGVTFEGFPSLEGVTLTQDEWQGLLSDLKSNGEARLDREFGVYGDEDRPGRDPILLTRADETSVNETNPEDPNAGAEFARQEREAGARVNQDSGLENATPAAPIIKKPRAPRKKPAAPNPSVFPTKLDSTLPFGRLTGDQMAQFGLSDAMLDQFVEHSTTGHVMSGVEFVKSAEDAAHVVAGLRKRPQEQVILLITDKNGRPIQIAEHMLSQPQACGFNPGILIGTAASTPGAAKVWFIHNHPSGKPTLSPADISAGGNIQKLTEAANLKFEGTMAIAGTRFAQLTPSGRIEGNLAIKAAPRKFKVPITERMFAFRVSQDAKQINDPAIAMAEAERIFGQTQPGIMLLDNSNRLVATIPLAADVLQAMKAKIPGTDQTGFNRYVAGIDRSNPVNAMIYTADVDAGVARKIIQNISGMAGATKINVLDAFGVGGISRQSDIRTYGSDFQEEGSDYNPDEGQPQGEPKNLRDVVDQAAKKKK